LPKVPGLQARDFWAQARVVRARLLYGGKHDCANRRVDRDIVAFDDNVARQIAEPRQAAAEEHQQTDHKKPGTGDHEKFGSLVHHRSS
jgi:hypothetical protein